MPFAGERNRFAQVRVFLVLGCGLAFLFGGGSSSLQAAEIDDAKQAFVKGQYSNCIHLCQQAIGEQEYGEEWRLLLIQSLMTVGQYTNAFSVLTNNLERYSSSLR